MQIFCARRLRGDAQGTEHSKEKRMRFERERPRPAWVNGAEKDCLDGNRWKSVSLLPSEPWEDSFIPPLHTCFCSDLDFAVVPEKTDTMKWVSHHGKKRETSLVELLGQTDTFIPNFNNLKMSRWCSCSFTLTQNQFFNHGWNIYYNRFQRTALKWLLYEHLDCREGMKKEGFCLWYFKQKPLSLNIEKKVACLVEVKEPSAFGEAVSKKKKVLF